MPNTTLRRPTLNIPLLALWVVAIAVLAFGSWMLLAGNAAQAEFYTSGGDDYLEYLNLQTQSTIGGFLLIAGVIGLLLALATHARNHAASLLATRVGAPDDTSVEASDDLEDDADAAVEPSDADVATDSEDEPGAARTGDAEHEPATTPEPVRA